MFCFPSLPQGNSHDSIENRKEQFRDNQWQSPTSSSRRQLAPGHRQDIRPLVITRLKWNISKKPSIGRPEGMSFSSTWICGWHHPYCVHSHSNRDHQARKIGGKSTSGTLKETSDRHVSSIIAMRLFVLLPLDDRSGDVEKKTKQNTSKDYNFVLFRARLYFDSRHRSKPFRKKSQRLDYVNENKMSFSRASEANGRKRERERERAETLKEKGRK